MLLALEIFFKSSRCKTVGYLILIFSIWLVEDKIIKKKLKGDFEFFEEVARIVPWVYLGTRFVLDMLFI